MRRQLKYLLVLGVGVVVALGAPQTAMAVNNSTFNQTINAGVLSVDVLDASQVSVPSPSVAMSAKSLSFACQSGGSASTGVLGTSSERIYVMNPGGANNGWTLGLAPTVSTATWVSGGNSFDFNDAGTSGCSDGADADAKGGQLTVNPTPGTVTADCSGSCTTGSITKGTSAAFVESTTDSVNLLTAAIGSDDIWRGYFMGATFSQTIPAQTPAGTYTINMTLTATAL